MLPFKTVLDLPVFATPSTQLCRHCGAQMPPLAANCTVCGRSLRAQPDETPTEVGEASPSAMEVTADEQQTAMHSEYDVTVGRADWSDQSPFAEPVPDLEPRSETAQIRAVFTSLQPSPPAGSPPSRPPAAAASAREPPASIPAGVRLARSLADEFVDDESEAETLPERTAQRKMMDAAAVAAPDGGNSSVLTRVARPLEPTAPVPEEVVASLRARHLAAEAAARPAVPDPAPLPPQFAPLGVEAPPPEPAHPDSPEQRLAVASRAVERSLDRSSPRMAVIKADSGQAAEPREEPAVRAALEPALARGRQRASVGHDDQTSVYPAVQKKGVAAAPAAEEGAAPAPAAPEPEPVPAERADLAPRLAVEAPASLRRGLESVQMVLDSDGICTGCGAAIAAGNRFCGECGRPAASHRQTRAIPQRRRRDEDDETAADGCRARLVLLRGSGAIGSVWPLGNDVNRAGRVHGNVLFANDPFLSPWHATFFYRDTKLLVRDDNSRNGVFLRLRKPEPVQERDRICIGRQLLMVLSRESWAPAVVDRTGDATDTRLLASPRGLEAIYLARIFTGGDAEVYLRHQRTLSLGRNGCDINFPDDDFLSQRHCRILRAGDYTVVEDLGSRNGTFLAIRSERMLENGDELMIGNQVLRLEIL